MARWQIDGERIDAFVMHEDVEPHEVGVAEAKELVIHGAVALGGGFEFVIQVVNNFRERHLVNENGPRGAEILGANVGAAALGAHAP